MRTLAGQHDVALQLLEQSAVNFDDARGLPTVASGRRERAHEPAAPTLGSSHELPVWAWVAAQLDSSNRPLVVPAGAGQNNAFGSTGAPANGQLGSMGVVPFFGTTSMPVNLGAGTNETRIVVGRWQNSYLWESEGRTRVLPDVGSDTLTVRLQFYRYAAVAHRNPASYALISGTGLIMPAGY